jgi:hypothetical protein
MARRMAVLVMALLLAPLSPAAAQTAPAAPAAPGAPSSPASPTPFARTPVTPGDFASFPHPGGLWFGSLIRWTRIPDRVFSLGGQVLTQPGYWVAETTTGFYHLDHWELVQMAGGALGWRLVPRFFVQKPPLIEPR